MGSLTIYTVNADLELLRGILNGVAMICQQVVFIWGFALLASLYRITAGVSGAALASVSSDQGGAVLKKGSANAVMPFVFAMFLTTPGFQTTVNVESTINSTVTSVAGVPIVIAIIPAAGTLFTQELGTLVETAFQGVGTDYPSISASGNGFINPLKMLLTSRTAMLRLGGIDSQVRSVVTSCLGGDSGVDHAAIAAMVMNAGNTGATAAQSIPINGEAPTAIGALLWQAAQNNVGLVPDIGSGSQSILSCADAAVAVANSITDALNSAEFARVVQGAVNGMDQPVAGANLSFSQITQNYRAMRTANTTLSALAGGAAQANAEVINLLSSEMVGNSLNCIRADSSNKTTCMAATIQANEIERQNIQAASNEVPLLKYAGSLANSIIALIIGLGPAVVMFMMFSGVDAGKNIKVTAHIIVWPLLCMNVGAELINGMIYIQVANFMKSISQGGVISQAVAIEAYKAFSLQIGTASHLMSSLPVLMSTIFALGASSALSSVVKSASPDTKDTADAVTPKAMSSTPLMNQQSMYTAQHGDGFVVGQMTGAIKSVASSAQFQNLTNEQSARLSKTEGITKTISEGSSNLAAWKNAFSTGDYSKFDLTKTEGDAIKNRYEQSERANHHWGSGEDVNSTKSNANHSQVSAGGSVSLGIGKGSAPFNLGISAGANTNTTANDGLSDNRKTAEQRAIDESKSLSKALEEDIGKRKSTSVGKEKARRLEKSLDTQKSYQNTLSEQKSTQSATDKAVKESANFVGFQGSIGATEISQQMEANSDYQKFQAISGARISDLNAARPYLEKAREAMDSGSTDGVVGSPKAREAAIRHSAMVRMAEDEKAPSEQRLGALSYLTAESKAMMGMGYQHGDTSMKQFDLEEPQDKTGIDSQRLQTKADSTQPKPPAPKPSKPIKGKKKPVAVRPSNPPPSFKDQVNAEVHAKGVKEEVAAGRKIAADAGLNANGHGTAIRVAANVADNAASIIRPSGTPDRTHLGNLEVPAAEQNSKGRVAIGKIQK